MENISCVTKLFRNFKVFPFLWAVTVSIIYRRLTGWLKNSEGSRHDLIEVICRNFSGGTEGNDENTQVSQCLRRDWNQALRRNKSLRYCYTIILGKMINIYIRFTQMKIDQIVFMFNRSVGCIAAGLHQHNRSWFQFRLGPRVFPRLSLVLKWVFLFDEKRGLTTTVLSPLLGVTQAGTH
jgi:hypothetical protein